MISGNLGGEIDWEGAGMDERQLHGYIQVNCGIIYGGNLSRKILNKEKHAINGL